MARLTRKIAERIVSQEIDPLLGELESLRAWKAEAMEVLEPFVRAEWDARRDAPIGVESAHLAAARRLVEEEGR